MDYFKVRNFERFQHYGNRHMIWIKLYISILHNQEFRVLPDCAKFHLTGIFLLAGEMGNCIPADPDFIRAKLEATEPIDLTHFSHWIEPCGPSGASTNASNGARAYRERERKKERMDLSTNPPADAGASKANPAKVSQSPKPRKEPTGAHAEIVAYFVTRWQKRHGVKYPFLKKDGVAASKVLKAAGSIELAKRIVDRFVSCDEPFVARQKHPLSLLLNQITRWLTEAKANGQARIFVEDN